jgi:hypothetical protein
MSSGWLTVWLARDGWLVGWLVGWWLVGGWLLQRGGDGALRALTEAMQPVDNGQSSERWPTTGPQRIGRAGSDPRGRI